MMTVSDEIHLNNYDPVEEKYANPADKFSIVRMSVEDREKKCK